MKFKIKIGVLIITMMISLFSCTLKESKFNWLASGSAFKNFPMELIKGEFLDEDNNYIVYIPDNRTINNGWGMAASTHIVGEEFIKLPHKFNIYWFSYTEDKFFKGEFNLPYDSLYKKCNEIRINSLKEEELYNNYRITVGLAPKGKITVWLQSSFHIIEIASYKAEETEMDWKRVLDNPEITKQDYIKMILDECSKNYKDFVKYKNRYNNDLLLESELDVIDIKINLNIKVKGAKPIYFKLYNYNGEQEEFYFLDNKKLNNKERGVPKSVRLIWENLKKEEYSFDLIFNKNEIIEIFRNLSKKQSKNVIELILDINEETFKLDIFIKNNEEKLKLTKTDIKVYSR